MTLTSRNDVLWITFYHQSKRIRKSLNLKDTKANRKHATKQIIPELLYKLNSGEFFNNDNEQKDKVPTVGEFAPISFEIHKHERRELTRKSYSKTYAIHIKPHFAKKRIDDIKASHLAKWQNMLLETLSPKRVKTVRTIFNTILDDAYRDELIKRNPFSLVKSPTNKDIIEKRPFNKQEIFQILDEVAESMKAFFAIGFFTGMRTGEIIGLKWEDIDLKARTIKVQRSRREGIETAPKTKNSIREIDIIDVLLPYLKAHYEMCKDRIYVFETAWHKPYNTTSKISLWYWRATLEKLDIPYRNLYQMRHTFASLMISNGEDILWVAQMLGHKDASMTLKKYARYIKAKEKKRASFLL